MDKITHQVRAEHWARILNECMNSGMPKTAWCRANGISEKQFFYWQRILPGKRMKHLRMSLPAVTRQDSYLPFSSRYLLLRSNSLPAMPTHHPFFIRIL